MINDVHTPNRKPKVSKKARWFKYYQKLNRPSLRWIAAGLLPYGFLSDTVSEAKFSAFLIFLGAIYGIRGIETKIGEVMNPTTTRQPRSYGYDTRVEPDMDAANYTPSASTPKYHTVKATGRHPPRDDDYMGND